MSTLQARQSSAGEGHEPAQPPADTPDQGLRVGVDIGGTFTDLVFSMPDGSLQKLKVPSTPDSFSRAITDGIARFCAEHGIAPEQIDEIVHATTVATNAILERRGARAALITTEGFRDVLELRRIRIPMSYDLGWEKPVPLIPRRDRFEFRERIAASGQVIVPPDRESLERIVAAIEAGGFESVAISLLHAYRDGHHERLCADAIARALPDIGISMSHEILPEMLEFERTSTTVVNAYVGPLIRRYLDTLRTELDRLGARAPVLVMQSNGGLISRNAASHKPVTIIESGPAAGVVAAQRLSHECGYANLLTLDMGGTTSKASIIEEGEVLRATEYEVGSAVSISSRLMRGNGYVLRIPVIDISEVGAGGGSLASIDSGGSMRVGPRSAGASPGPACYGHGNTRPTVTDANLLLGYLGSESLAGGSLRVDPELARLAIEEHLCQATGMDVLDAAFGVHLIANSNMVRAIKTISVERGRDPADFGLLVFGGAGPIHAVGVARELGIRTVIVPPSPGVFSAFGLLRADVEQHASRTILTPTDAPDTERLQAGIAAMTHDLIAALSAEGYAPDRITVRYFADLRYRGQSSEITVPMSLDTDSLPDLRALEGAFETEFERTYGYRDRGGQFDIVTVRALGTVLRSMDGFSDWERETDASEPPLTHRACFFGAEQGVQQTPVIRRAALSQGTLAGPLIIQEYDTHIVIPPGSSARLDDRGNVVVDVFGPPAL
jgi:N-methylhydantoinase A